MVAAAAGAAMVVLAVLLSRPPGPVISEQSSAGAPQPPAPPAPGTLLAQVLEAHGGTERWRRLRALRAKVRFGGLAFKLRFAEPVPAVRWAECDLRVPRAVIHDYPRAGQRGVFTRDRVWIESADGQLLRALDHPREKLLGSRRRQLWWDDLDLLYFAGYALWNYLQGPFLLLQDGVETREIAPWAEDGETWRRLAVRFHDAVPTHGREQVFYFDASFRQRRHDYRPDVYAAWAHASHYTFDYRWFDGLWVPTRRTVVPRGRGHPGANGPVLVWIEVLSVEVAADSG